MNVLMEETAPGSVNSWLVVAGEEQRRYSHGRKKQTRLIWTLVGPKTSRLP